MTQRQAHSIDELNGLTSALHDWWVDVSALTIEGRTATLFLHERGHSASRAAPSKKLMVGCVDRAEVDDEQRIGFYDINRIIGTSDPLTIVVEFNIPTTCRFVVDKVDVRLTCINQPGRG